MSDAYWPRPNLWSSIMSSPVVDSEARDVLPHQVITACLNVRG